ncbi:M56 family metallopeptidase [Streptomyces sp. NRRL S-646]|uniref:M56 family metallopeptidase n=1 Tax=Streptomyces sp. NRRL S-646 TaxID=1463917 RepID=UPI0004C76C90|nr:M56 family metallopeptidase [Streptomyces sp. NRRL S-646]
MRATGAGTTQRFVLLVVLFVAGTLSMLSNLLSLLTDPRNTLGGCALAAGFNGERNDPANVLAQATPAYHACVDHYVGRWKLLWLPLIATLVVMLLAVLLYVLIPRWKGRRARVVALQQADVVEWLTELAATSALRRAPRFVMDPKTLFGANAVVFGRPGRYTVRLDLGLVKLFHEDRSAFEATLLHEFAHIRNRDVDIAYLTVAVWRVFLIGVLLPFVAVNGWKLITADPAPGLARNLVLAAFMVVLMYLTTADVLRSREIHADLDAVAQGADARYWTRHQGRRPVRRKVVSLLLTHPDWEVRVAALADASAPVALGALPMVLTGVSVQLLGYLITFTPGLNNYLPAWLADPGVWPAAALATAVGGIAVWRGVVHDRGGGARPSGLRAGLWLGAGQFGGELAVSQFLGNQWAPEFPEAFLLLLLLVVPAAVLWWTAGCAALFAGLPSGWRSSAGAVTLAVTCLAFAWWHGSWQAVGTTFSGGMPYSASSALAFLNDGFAPADRLTPSTTSHVIAVLTVVVVSLASHGWGMWLTAGLWIVPLAGLARRPRSAGTACGLLFGAAAGVGVIAVTHRAQVWIWHDRQPFVPSVTVYTGWLFAILLCGAVGAALAAVWVSRGDAAATTAAAGSAMAIGLAVLLVVNGTDGCVGPLNIVRSGCEIAADGDWQVLTFFLPELLAVAGMATVAAALPVAVAVKLSLRGRRVLDRQRSPRRRDLRLIGTVAACGVLASLCAATYADVRASGGRSDRAGFDPFITRLQRDPVSSRRLGMQIWAWGYFGGADLMGDYERALADIDRSVNRDGSVDGTAIRRGCTDLLRTIDRAEAYFPIPASAEQSVWSGVLTSSRTSAQDCLGALPVTNWKELRPVLTELNPPVDPVAALFDNLVELAKPAGMRLRTG